MTGIAGLVIALYLLASFFALIYPRRAMLLFWPLIFLHPDWLLFNKLPLNAGLDDVFIVSLFVGSLIRSMGRLQVIWPVVAAILFCVLTLLGDISSLAIGVELDLQMVVKTALKRSGLILLLFSMSSVITTPEQIKKMVYSLLFGAMLGGALVILYTATPWAYNPFQIPAFFLGKEAYQVQIIGPFSSHDRAGGVLGFTVLIGYFLIRLSGSGLRRSVLAIVTGVSFLGLLLSGSRSGWLFVLVPIMLSSLLSKQKILGLFLIALLVIIVIVSVPRFEYLSNRFLQTTEQLGGRELEHVTSSRYMIWKKALSNPNARWLLFGEGITKEEGQTHTHSNYIAMLTNMGCIGILFWIVYYKRIFAKSIWLKKNDLDPDMAALFRAMPWIYIGYFMFFIPSTPLQWSPVRYIDFFLMTLVYLRYKQIQIEEEYMYEDQLYEEASLDYGQPY